MFYLRIILKMWDNVNAPFYNINSTHINKSKNRWSMKQDLGTISKCDNDYFH